MTDKAIGALIEANDRARSLGFVTGTTNWAGVLAKAVAAQPDCRTCRFHHELGCYQYMSNMRDTTKHCINGDKYVEAPAVVLWRTE